MHLTGWAKQKLFLQSVELTKIKANRVPGSKFFLSALKCVELKFLFLRDTEERLPGAPAKGKLCRQASTQTYDENCKLDLCTSLLRGCDINKFGLLFGGGAEGTNPAAERQTDWKKVSLRKVTLI